MQYLHCWCIGDIIVLYWAVVILFQTGTAAYSAPLPGPAAPKVLGKVSHSENTCHHWPPAVYPVDYGSSRVALLALGQLCKGYFLLCFLFGLYYQFLWIHVTHLPISFRIASLALGQSCDCPSACEVTLKDIGKQVSDVHNGPTQQSMNHVRNSSDVPLKFQWYLMRSHQPFWRMSEEWKCVH